LRAFSFYTRSPKQPPFTQKRTRAFVTHRLTYDGTDVGMDEDFHWKYLKQAFLQICQSLDLRGEYIHSVLTISEAWFLTLLAFLRISLFLLSIIIQIGCSEPKAQIITVPVYFCACFICIFVMAFLSNHEKQRGSFVGGLLLLALVWFFLVLASSKPGAKYAGGLSRRLRSRAACTVFA